MQLQFRTTRFQSRCQDATAEERRHLRVLLGTMAFVNIESQREGSHSGLVRAPAKRLACENGLMGSNPIPSATFMFYKVQ